MSVPPVTLADDLKDNDEPPFKTHVANLGNDTFSVSCVQGGGWNWSLHFFVVCRTGEEWSIFRNNTMRTESWVEDVPTKEAAIEKIRLGEIK